MEKIKEIHNKVGKCFNSSFRKGFSDSLNAFGNIMPSPNASTITHREVQHYNKVNKFINNSWRTVGEHINGAVINTGSAVNSSDMPSHGVKRACPPARTTRIVNITSPYSTNSKTKLDLNNDS